MSGWAIPIGPVFCLMAVILNYNGGLDVTYLFRDGIKNEEEIKNTKKTEVALAISLAAIMTVIAILLLWVFHGYEYF